jgi:hypothetical protein
MSKLTAIERAVWGRGDEHTLLAGLSERMSDTGFAYQESQRQWNEACKSYCKELRVVVLRKARKITVDLLNCYHPEVEVFPLHDHKAHETNPLLTIRLHNYGLKLEVSCMAYSVERVEALLSKFRAMVQIEADSRKETAK